jgi:hypothetical protein
MPSIDDNGIECKEMNPFPTVHPQLVCFMIEGVIRSGRELE